MMVHNLIPNLDRPGGSRHRSPGFIFFAAGLLGLLVSGCAGQGQPSALDPKGVFSTPVTTLFWVLAGFFAAVLLVVTALLLIAANRKPRADQRAGYPLTGDRRALRWVLIGGVAAPVIVLIIVLALGFSIETASANNQNSSAGDLVIEVISHQWWWEILYPNDGFVTANEIHIPAGRLVTLKLTSADVLHSFWVPQLHPQMDMIPGQTNTITIQADQPGTYPGECAEFCGLQHAHMELVVTAQSQADYDQWAHQQKQPAIDPPVGSIEKSGQQDFLGSACVYCHAIQGTNASGRLGPDLTHFASRATIGAGVLPNTLANLAGWISNAQGIKPGNLMPPMNLDPDQLQALLAYLETLK